jgi:phosphoribosylformimino-5-aminoimidazole carboxamide ribonucleotide (ProFAR) isomerase
MALSLTAKTIDKYFGFLSRLDNRSKKNLIIKLTESIEEKEKKTVHLKDLSGAWDDSRESDEIIEEIRKSRVEKQDNIDF